MKHKSSVDMITGVTLSYPFEVQKLKYDFHFTKNGVWYYINSNNKLAAFKNQKQIVESRGESWRVVESSTGRVVQKS